MFKSLLAAYREPHRKYHNDVHIDACLLEFATARHLAHHPDEVELAIWFHDAIYDTRAKDNEERSAAWLVTELDKAAARRGIISRVRDLILATKHDQLLADHDQQLMTDTDLAILGKPPEEFDQYDRQIHEEYSWVEDSLYRSGRQAVLQHFLHRSTIYGTDYFRERYESQARLNLQRAIALLKPKLPLDQKEPCAESAQGSE